MLKGKTIRQQKQTTRIPPEGEEERSTSLLCCVGSMSCWWYPEMRNAMRIALAATTFGAAVTDMKNMNADK